MALSTKKNKTLIIAEVGVNHNGKLSLAKKLINLSASSGADIVKFQVYNTEDFVTKKSSAADYQKKNTKIYSQYNLLKKYELSEKQITILNLYSKKKKIEFLISPFDFKSIELVKKLKCKRVKIPSGEINNLPYLEKIGKLKKKIILSSGMSTMKEIYNAIQILISKGVKKKDITVLHCNTAYPSPPKDLNLNALQLIKSKLKINIGYSDHSNSLEAPIIAVSLGATIYEKHITLNNNMIGPDHSSSFDFSMFSKLVKNIRKTEILLGAKQKLITESEKRNISIVRKSIVAIKQIKKNEKFNVKNISTKRPGTGLSPMLFNKIIGKKSKKNFKKDDLIKI